MWFVMTTIGWLSTFSPEERCLQVTNYSMVFYYATRTNIIPPEDDLLQYFQDDLVLLQQWRIDGRNYGMTRLEFIFISPKFS